MILGAFIAAMKDLNFDAMGYVYVMANNVFSAGNYVVTKVLLYLSGGVLGLELARSMCSSLQNGELEKRDQHKIQKKRWGSVDGAML